jgi:hypothetical protein
VSAPERPNKWVVGAGAAVLLVIAEPLWNEFNVPGNRVWNAFLTLFLAGLAIAAVLLGRYFYTHSAEIGEARFDTRNRTDR